MGTVTASFLLGVVAAVPLILGALYAFWRRPRMQVVGLVAAFGAGALISAVSFDLVEEAIDRGAPAALALALTLGAVVYYAGDRYLEGRERSPRGAVHRGQADTTTRGLALLFGAALDGVPESFILGQSFAASGAVGSAFFLAVVVSNLPEGMASAAELADDARVSRRRVLGMWAVVVFLCGLTAALGAWLAEDSELAGALAQSFAAGALLTMLADDLIPEAREEAAAASGLMVVVGFAVAFALHHFGQ